MEDTNFIIPEHLEPFVNKIMVMEGDDPNGSYTIPLYADGYPGIMFQQSENGFYLLPKQKKLSELFLYGQTIDPAFLDVKGRYKFVVFQLYPFASKYLLGVDPKKLNDDCYDLLALKHIDIASFKERMECAKTLDQLSGIVAELILVLVKTHKQKTDDRIQKAISLIIQSEGLKSIKDIVAELYLTERTLERNFKHEIGLTPKQFSKIVQFQSSLSHLTKSKYKKLVEVGNDSGFADQSHFIRIFKRYTGQTPSYYLKQLG